LLHHVVLEIGHAPQRPQVAVVGGRELAEYEFPGLHTVGPEEVVETQILGVESFSRFQDILVQLPPAIRIDQFPQIA